MRFACASQNSIPNPAKWSHVAAPQRRQFLPHRADRRPAASPISFAALRFVCEGEQMQNPVRREVLLLQQKTPPAIGKRARLARACPGNHQRRTEAALSPPHAAARSVPFKGHLNIDSVGQVDRRIKWLQYILARHALESVKPKPESKKRKLNSIFFGHWAFGAAFVSLFVIQSLPRGNSQCPRPKP